jgi:hypothetical protein
MYGEVDTFPTPWWNVGLGCRITNRPVPECGRGAGRDPVKRWSGTTEVATRRNARGCGVPWPISLLPWIDPIEGQPRRFAASSPSTRARASNAEVRKTMSCAATAWLGTMNLLLSSLEVWRRLVMKSLLTHWITEETPARVDRRCCTFFSHPGGRGPAASAAARPTYQSAAT